MSRGPLAAGWRWARRILLGVLGAYLVLGILAWVFQRRLIYFPDPGPVPLPSGSGWRDLQAISIRTRDGVDLQAWYLPGATSTTVLVFHGNAGHRGHRAGLVQGLRALGFGVLLPDYRGYGGSAGEPSESGFYADGAACVDWLKAHTQGPVVYLGSSIGGGVAVEMARREAPAALILQSAFPSLAAVARQAYPFFPVTPFLRDRFANVEKVPALTCPVLCLHGDADRIVPVSLGRSLYDAVGGPKRWVEIPGAGHNDLMLLAGVRYFDAIEAFLREHVK